MRCIPLTRGYVAIISAKHYRRVNRHSWHVHMSRGTRKKPGQPYARATIEGKKVYLHRFVKDDEISQKLLEGCTDNESLWHVDHKNHQTLDCRDENLKVCLYVENLSTRRNLLKNRKKKVDIKMDSSNLPSADGINSGSFTITERGVA
jgi:hypothetical protein